jgi:hypothetical protein
MRTRTAGLLALTAALLGWFLVVAPGRKEVSAARDRFGRSRVERDRQRARVATLEHGAERRARLAAAVGGEAVADPASALRWRVLREVEKAGVSGVRLDVSPGRGTGEADLQLDATGDLAAVRRLVAALSAPEVGLALASVDLRTAATGRINVGIHGSSLAGQR